MVAGSRLLTGVFASIALLCVTVGCGGGGSAPMPAAVNAGQAALERVAPETSSANLVVNGGAEANVGASSSSTIVPPSGWSTTGQFTAVQYGTSGFPSATSPGPPTRGKNFFAGGNAPSSTARQSISLAAYSTPIDAGAEHFAFSAWIGGYEDQGDNASVLLTFKDVADKTLGALELGPVTPAERKDVTGLFSRAADGTVPKGTRSALVSIVATRESGSYNDGYVDDIVLTVSTGVAPTATPTPKPTATPTAKPTATPTTKPTATPTPKPTAKPTATPSPVGTDIVVNGGAEANVGASNSSTIVPPKGWLTAGQATVVQYGSGGFPSATDPGPPVRGKNFFAGGNAAVSSAKQSISLAKFAAAIAAGTEKFTFSAWLGGYESQGDNAVVAAAFKSAAGTTLGNVVLGPVTPAERKDVTGLFERSASGTVPKGSVTVEVTLLMTRDDGNYDDGYADNISLILSPAPVP